MAETWITCPQRCGLNLLDVPLIKPQKVTFDINVVIEMGA